jgi:hypothetical protein
MLFQLVQTVMQASMFEYNEMRAKYATRLAQFGFQKNEETTVPRPFFREATTPLGVSMFCRLEVLPLVVQGGLKQAS